MLKMRSTAVLAVTLLASLSTAGLASSPSYESLLSLAPGQEISVHVAPAVKVPQLSGEALFQQLHAQTEMSISPSGHSFSYLDAKKHMFSKADNTGCGGGPGVTCLYSQVCVRGSSGHGADYREQGDQNGDGFLSTDGMNAEHIWPQGFFDENYPMKADLHHLAPTFQKPNNARGSSPFGYVTGPIYATSAGSMSDGYEFEPADAVKGNVARAVLYFVVRYYDKNIRDGVNYRNFWADRVQMFLDWNRQDPPDAFEQYRNEQIYRYQGNRNPFVDDPSLAERVGAQVFKSH